MNFTGTVRLLGVSHSHRSKTERTRGLTTAYTCYLEARLT